MQASRIEGKRKEIGMTQKEVADVLGIKVSTYRKKAFPPGRFSDEQKILLSKLFSLDYRQFNDIFYEGQLPPP